MSKYNISKNVRKFPEGGYGAYDYDNNEAYLQYTWGQVQKDSQAATDAYNQTNVSTAENYQNFLESSYLQANQSLKNYNTVKSGINTTLQGKVKGTNQSWNQNINNRITNAFSGKNPQYGVGPGSTGYPTKAEVKGLTKSNKGLSVWDPNYQASPNYMQTYDQWSEFQGEMATTKGETFTPTRNAYRQYKQEYQESMRVPRDAAGMPLRGEELTAWQEGKQETIQKGIFEKGRYTGVSSDTLNLAAERGTQIGEGFSTASGETYEMTSKGLKQTHSNYGEAVKGGNMFVNTASKAPVKGGLWTVPVDIGLHYLSDDNDPSTYTAGEVATDIGSLALDIVTFDWIGAVMQIGDMVVQGVTAKKLKKKIKNENRRISALNDKAQYDYEQAWAESRRQPYDARYSTGRRSGFSNTGYGNLGGFKYNI